MAYILAFNSEYLSAEPASNGVCLSAKPTLAAVMAGVLTPSGGPDTRKPFTYCPGGIDFSELKSPRMARRIAKHQSQMESAVQQLPNVTAGVEQQQLPAVTNQQVKERKNEEELQKFFYSKLKNTNKACKAFF